MAAIRGARAPRTGRPAGIRERPDQSTGKFDRRAVAFGVALVAINLTVKLLRPTTDGIWLDEAVTMSLAQQPVSIARATAYDATPPLYYLLITGWTRTFGLSVNAFRSFSAVASSVTALLLFCLGRRFFDPATGVLAALLFTASNLQLHYAQEARCYALVGLLCAASWFAFLELFRTRSRVMIATLGVANAALLLTHYLAAFSLVAQVAAAAMLATRTGERARRDFAWSLATTGLLCTPWALVVYRRWPPIKADWLARPEPRDLAYTLDLFTGLSLSPAGYALAILGLIVVAWAVSRPAWSTRADAGSWRRFLVLLCWAALPPLLAYFASAITPVFLGRYILYATLGLCLLVAYIVSLLPWTLLRLLAAGVLLGHLFVRLPIDPLPRADWPGAVAAARAASTDGGLIVVAPSFEALPFAYYFHPAAFRQPARTAAMLSEAGVEAVESLSQIEARVAGARRVVLISTGAGPIYPGGLFRRGFALTGRTDLSGLIVLVFDRPPPADRGLAGAAEPAAPRR